MIKTRKEKKKKKMMMIMVVVVYNLDSDGCIIMHRICTISGKACQYVLDKPYLIGIFILRKE